jgi:hypothetical protein
MPNQGPSTPIKYYPDANSGKGGYLQNTGAGRPGKVRPKGTAAFPLADRGITKAPKKHYG